MGQTKPRHRNFARRIAELPLIDELQTSGLEEAYVVASIREQIRLFGTERVRRL